MVQTLVRPAAARAAPATRPAGASGHTLEALLAENGFDRVQHEQIRADLRGGPHRPGAEPAAGQQRHPGCAAGRRVRCDADVRCLRRIVAAACATLGLDALRRRRGRRGHPGRRRRQPLDAGRGRGQGAASVLPAGRAAPHLHRGAPGQEPAHRPAGGPAAAARHHHQLSDARADRGVPGRGGDREGRPYGYRGPLHLSPGRAVGLRMVPMARDLRFAWEEMPQQLLDEQAQKVRDSLHAALIDWAQAGRRGQRLHRQPAAAVPAPGRPLVRGAEPAAQRRAGASAGRAAEPAVPDGAQHRHAGRRRGSRGARAG